MMMRSFYRTGFLFLAASLAGCGADGAEDGDTPDAAVRDRIARIHQEFVFADIHAHPSRFHRGEALRIEPDEIELYRRSSVDLVVAKASSDAAYDGGYVRRDGTRVPRTGQDPAEGYPFDFTVDRIERVLLAIEEGDAVLAESPAAVRRAKQEGAIALLPALEGADGLEGRLENLDALYDMGVRMIQLVHFRLNGIGHIQTDSAAGGLEDFGRDVVRRMNERDMIIDLAHANTETIMDVLAVSEDPVVFSHTGAKALHDAPRHLTDEEIRAIAEAGGVIGIWPNAAEVPRMEDLVRHVEHVREIAGIDHIAIGSDLRGVSGYTEGFGEDADFGAIAAALLAEGYSEEDVGKVMGGNFFRVWEEIAGVMGM